ncbi:C4-dicarboxylate ABC transporter permease [Agaricicola taiwanensis]|uniref:TRAP transporter large permease protein n=1 Tax=Agaricicola taiwanensis TaxID=591372 RepID=A0A8J2VSR9_9RHOB|nr:TRAP transporter large permease [Agaricicola taiwanensis]GGE37573.1 C4-dicarboxylate ABC transporter permease [Agaricicola taiwanensis]
MGGLGIATFGSLLVIGAPIYLVLGATAVLLLWLTGTPMITVAQKLADELNSQTLVAIPFFVIAATFMERGGIARALIDAITTWVGSIRGSLGLVCVLACTMFASMSGSSVATALAMGAILLPTMLRNGYDRSLSTGLIGAAGTVGILIPPSLAMVVYGLLADESVPRLFLGGVIPGLLQSAMIGGWVIYQARKRGYPTFKVQNREEFWAINLRAVPAYLIPLIVLGGIYGGIATVTEAAALSAIAAVLVSVFIYRTTKVSEIVPLLADGTRHAAAIMIIVVCALVFGHWVTESGLAPALIEAAQEWGMTRWQFLIVISLLLFVLGTFLEVFAVLLIAMPVIIPLLPVFNVDPIHFGIIVTINMELALLTPPVGMNLFVLSSISKAPLLEVIRGTTPFTILIAILMVLVIVFPELSLWLPRLVYG